MVCAVVILAAHLILLLGGNQPYLFSLLLLSGVILALFVGSGFVFLRIENEGVDGPSPHTDGIRFCFGMFFLPKALRDCLRLRLPLIDYLTDSWTKYPDREGGECP